MPGHSDPGIGRGVAPTASKLLRPGLDPGEHKGALGERFQAGVQDPHGLFLEKETRIADLVAAPGGIAVHPRKRDDRVPDKKNPDAMVRRGHDDIGTVTEFKTLRRASNSAVKRDILRAGKQLEQYGGGDAIIDGRVVNLTETEARRGYGRAAGTGSPMPQRVRIVLGDGSILEFPES